jgi:hypothetical protein
LLPSNDGMCERLSVVFLGFQARAISIKEIKRNAKDLWGKDIYHVS